MPEYSKRSLLVWVLIGCLGAGGRLAAQDEDGAADEKQDARAAAGLDKKGLEKMIKDVVEEEYSRGIITIGGAELRLGGKLELNFIDTQSERRSFLGGPTDNPDPHFRVDELRIEPVIDVGKGLEVEAQIDFIPEDGETLLKEAVVAWDYDVDWWLESDAQLGLDDPFIHIGPSDRLTESYPLIGTAFWRDEELALIWKVRVGDKRGAPRPKKKGAGKRREPLREEFTRSTDYDAFDFSNNPGEINLLFSIGNGYTLDDKAVTKDSGTLQRIIQDGREVESNLSLRDIGLGVGYERDFNNLGEIGALLFYYEDELNEDSVQVLQQGLTLIDGLTGLPVRGYGSSEANYRRRVGITANYHLEAYHLLSSFMDTWPGDGLYLTVQWIDARDGDLERDGWYAQVSYRWSFVKPLIDEKYFRYLEPVFRYGELKNNQAPIPSLPLSWTRRELVLGAVLGVNDHIFFKTEYLFNDETTGGGSVNNDEFLVQLLVLF